MTMNSNIKCLLVAAWIYVAFVTSTLVPVANASVGFGGCEKLLIDKSEPPHAPEGAVRICRDGFLAITYDVKMKNPAASAYYVTPTDIAHNIPGREAFYEDPDLQSLGIDQPSPNGPAFNASWQRGHCAPSEIMSSSMPSKHACYTMANIGVQSGSFNMEQWRHLEKQVYDWVGANSPLYIVTGVMYRDRSRPTWTYNSIAVPDYYFKVICDKTNKKSVGFYGENNPTAEGTFEFRSVKEVEKIYGGTLFPAGDCKTDDVDHSHWWTF